MDNVSDLYVLSPMQAGMLYLTERDAGDAYVEQVWWTFDEPLDRSRLQEAWTRTVAKFDILRTGFLWQELDHPLQVVFDAVPTAIAFPEASGSFDALRAAERTRFRLDEPPLARLVVHEPEGGPARALLVYHHILLDGWSVPLVVADLLAGYAALAGTAAEPGPALASYRSFVQWLGAQDPRGTTAFWREHLEGLTKPSLLLGLPLSAPTRPGFGTVERTLGPDATARLKAAAQAGRITLNTLLQGAWSAFLMEKTGERDVAFGSVVSGRQHDVPGIEAIPGLLINTVMRRWRAPEPGTTFGAWLEAAQAVSLRSQAHDFFPLAEAQKLTGLPPAAAPFDTLFVVENLPDFTGLLDPAGPKVSGFDRAPPRTGYPLTVDVFPGTETKVHLTFDEGRAGKAAVAELAADFLRVLDRLAGCLDAPFDLERLADPQAAEARHAALNRRSGEWDGRLMHERIADVARRHPDRPAVAAADGRLTYAELDAESDLVAREIAGLGLRPGAVVGVVARRSVGTVAAFLGAWKAGHPFLPLNPDVPAARLRAIAEDSGMAHLLGDRTGLPEDLPAGLRGAAPATAGAEPVAYVLFTSGSTGRPKGVPVTHASLSAYTSAILEIIGDEALAPGLAFAQVSSLDADLGNTCLYPALASGGCLHLVPETVYKDPAGFADYGEAHGIDVLKLTPGHLKALLAADGDPQVLPRVALFTGGEAVDLDFAHRVNRLRTCAWVNHYGLTETTVGSLTWRVPESLSGLAFSPALPIGVPIPGTFVRILSPSGRPCGVLEAGDLLIGGEGITPGYLGRPDLDAERFVPVEVDGAMRRAYRTGDRARILPDGSVQFLGRLDHQVKVRGYRIELADVEANALAIPGVREAVALAEPDGSGDRRLELYVAASDPSLDTARLRDALAARLPAHMLPGLIVPVAAIPRTANGKADAAGLRAAARERERAAAPASSRPMTALEARIAEVFAEHFPDRHVDADANFFHLGGDSLLAMRLVGALGRRLGSRVTLEALTRRQTVRELARELERGDEERRQVVRLKDGVGPALFCFHPIGGQILCYGEFARQLRRGGPIYGIQAAVEASDAVASDAAPTIESLARRYAGLIRAVQHSGPYRLMGWSMGGKLAFQVGAELAAQGERVERVIIIDSAPISLHAGDRLDPKAMTVQFLGDLAKLLRIEVPLDRLRRLPSEAQLQAFMRLARERSEFGASLDLTQLQAMCRVFVRNMNALVRYEPRPAPVEVGLIKTPLLHPDSVPDDWGWGRFALRGVVQTTVPGDHYSLLRQPTVATVTNQIEQWIDHHDIR